MTDLLPRLPGRSQSWFRRQVTEVEKMSPVKKLQDLKLRKNARKMVDVIWFHETITINNGQYPKIGLQWFMMFHVSFHLPKSILRRRLKILQLFTRWWGWRVPLKSSRAAHVSSSYIEHLPTSAWFYQLMWCWSIAVLDSSRTLKESTMLQCIICNLFKKALYFRDPRVTLTRYTNIPQICLTWDELAMLFSQPQYAGPHATPSYGVWF